MHTPFSRLAVGFILSTSWLAVFSANALTIDWDGGGGTSDWELPVNWSGDSLPSSFDQVSIGGADVNLSSAQTIDAFANLAGSVLTIRGNGSLTVGPSGISNAGEILLTISGGGPTGTLLAASGSTMLTGGGSVFLADSSATLGTSDPSNVLINVDNTIHGFAGILQNVENRSLIVSDQLFGVLTVQGIGNSGTVRADGGTLQVQSFIDQGSTGRIEAINNSAVELSGLSVVTGGTLATNTGGIIRNLGRATLDSVTLAGTLEITGGSTTVLQGGNFNNMGLVEIGPHGTGPAALTGTNVTLTGGGTIHLISSGGATAGVYPTSPGDQLVNIDNTIRGSGFVGGGVENRNLIVADDPSSPLFVQGIGNSGTVRADGGILQVQLFIDQGGSGRIEAINNSVVELTDVFVTGGTLVTNTGGIIRNLGTAVLDSVTLAGTLEIPGGSGTFLQGGNFNNKGLVEIGANGIGPAALTGTNVTLTGGGTIHLISGGGATAGVYPTSPGDQLVNIDNIIRGFGFVGMGVENRNLIVADQPFGVLTVQGIGNSGTVRADGGILQVQLFIDQGGSGRIEAINNSVVELADVFVNGGTLVTNTGGIIRNLGTAVLDSVTLAGTLDIPGGSGTFLQGGNFNNMGLVEIGANGAGPAALIGSNVTLTGGGTIHLISSGGAAASVYPTNSGDQLVNIDNIIRGSGFVGMGVENRNLIVADQPFGVLTVQGIGNSGTVRADGGILQVQLFIDQGGSGRIEAINNSVVELANVFVNGGTLVTNTGGIIRNLGTAALDSVTLAGTLDMPGGTTTFLQGGNFNNMGLVEIGANGIGPAALIGTNVTLTGGGTIHLISSGGATAGVYPASPGDQLVNIDNTIRGSGFVGMGVENRNLIVADDPSSPLSVQGIANSGTVRADGGTLQIEHSMDQGGTGRIEAVHNSVAAFSDVTVTGGTIAASDGGELHFPANSIVTGHIRVDGGTLEINGLLAANDIDLLGASTLKLNEKLSLSGDFSFSITDPTLFQVQAGSELELTGGVDAAPGLWEGWQSLEIGGHDYGFDPITHTGNVIGFTGNFSLATLRIGPGSHVLLTDLFNNSIGTPDALYVDSIIFDDPTGVLNLNGSNLYYNSISGAPYQIINNTVSIPEPSSAFAIASGALLLITRRNRRSSRASMKS